MSLFNRNRGQASILSATGNEVVAVGASEALDTLGTPVQTIPPRVIASVVQAGGLTAQLALPAAKLSGRLVLLTGESAEAMSKQARPNQGRGG